jgi:hypothetical protein
MNYRYFSLIKMKNRYLITQTAAVTSLFSTPPFFLFVSDTD